MDKSVLIEYADMKEEIRDLRRRIEKDRRELDGLKGRKPIRTVRIQGKPTKAIERKQKALEGNIARREHMEAELLELQGQAEEYIEGIRRSELRIMFRLYYIDDLTWYQVAIEMNRIFPKRRIKYTEDGCRMRHNRFLEKIE